MGKIYGYYEYDESLTPGRSADGGLSQLLFDNEGKLSDHASFHPEDPDDDEDYRYHATLPTNDTESAALLILAVIGAAAGAYILVRKASPQVQRMLTERALPAVRSVWRKVRGQGSEADSPDAGEASIVVVSTPLPHLDAAAPGTDVFVAKPQMSADEWYERFRAMCAARKFADEQWKLLSSAQVADDEVIAELQREMTHTRPEAVVRQVTLMLEAARETDADADADADAGAERMPLEDESDPGQRP
ncbi:hypothetical protein [Curtobacterium sp. MCBD17_021]|uniref:hypothetical protein n=1 Tax=Curtobacterium sp. MCBD17_021 TaxID=2175665 RepID=UPI000DA9D7F9|nr:hypothetical protein [Curtobacterium sp. MCBD17_021]PZE68760.1 hypothetical protein DEI83_02180 [Curtobacterium sp. MCBD17_021]